MNALDTINKLDNLNEIVGTLRKVLDFMDVDDRFSLSEMDIIAEIKDKYEKEIEDLKNELSKIQLKL